MRRLLPTLLFTLACAMTAQAQVYNEIDESGNITQRNENEHQNQNFNPNRRDSVGGNKVVPKGVWAWTVDRRFGDITHVPLDTMPHLFQNSVYATGRYGEYNTIGTNFSARQHRIFIDRPAASEFFFVDAYSFMTKEPDQFHFLNTLSPYTNISYDDCGDKQHGEDHVSGKFAVNANKQLGFGFDLDYHYARGYYQNQANSNFRATLFSSYRGDRYQMHFMGSAYHRKTNENGGITNDNYITHPEMEATQYSEEEIPTVLSKNWNRNDSQHLFFTHRYNVGFYRKVKMTEEEIKAREFASKSAKQKKEREDKEKGEKKDESLGRKNAKVVGDAPTGRPANAKIMGDEPVKGSNKVAKDSTRIHVDSEATRDSLLAEQARQDSIDATMKKEYVPVTSFIHTLDINNYDRIYQASATPKDYYANTYYDNDPEGKSGGESIFDNYKYTNIKNTFGIALLEGFNKYMKAGLKGFVSFDYRKYQMPNLAENATTYFLEKHSEHCLNVGGQLSKTQGKAFHFNLGAEIGITGLESGMLKLDFSTDVNFKLLGDTVRLAAKSYFHRTKPRYFMNSYHSKHLWWDQSLSSETRTHVEGIFTYDKTNTRLRVAIDEIQNYTYFGMSYEYSTTGRKALTGGVYQESGNINVLTAQLEQSMHLGVLNWENIITYQNSSKKEVLPLPTLNLFTNLYLKFKIARVLSVELGSCLTWFSKYEAPDYLPQISQFAIQKNSESRIKIGGYPFIDVYANMHLKRARFFVAMSHVNAGSGSKEYFLAPHYPTNLRILRFGISWNFYN
ncbi:MAG: putative porin [Prevotella sp.]|nr:putative porin [Prevotella sp.]